MGQLYVGIDWADDHHDIYITDNAAIELDSFSISHSSEGMEKLMKRVDRCCTGREAVLVAIESHQDC